VAKSSLEHSRPVKAQRIRCDLISICDGTYEMGEESASSIALFEDTKLEREEKEGKGKE
jgi:hypothetical protein